MNNLTALQSRKKNIARLNRNSKLFKSILVICQASNAPQLKAIADNVEAEAKKNCNELAIKHEGRKAQQWILIDYINIVVHVMLPEPRKFYQLEEMWSDAPMMQHD